MSNSLPLKEKWGIMWILIPGENLVSQIDDAHFVGGSSSGSRNSFGSRADYDPKFEKITECDIQGNSAQVYSEKYDETLKSSNYHVYDLECGAGGNWLISGIFTLSHPPKDPVIGSDRHSEILGVSTPNSSFVKGEENLNLNENILFQKDRNIKISHLDEGIAKLDQIGKLHVIQADTTSWRGLIQTLGRSRACR
jgi:hypothetical protein